MNNRLLINGNTTKNLKIYIFLFLVIAVLISVMGAYYKYENENSALKRKVEKEISKIEQENEITFFEINKLIKNPKEIKTGALFKRCQSGKKYLYLFKDDSLLVWNNNKIPVEKLNFGKDSVFLYFLNDEVYFADLKNFENYKAVIFDKLNDDIAGCKDLTNVAPKCTGIKIGNKKYYISHNENDVIKSVASVLFIAGYFLLLLIVFLLYRWLIEKNGLKYFYYPFFIIDVLIIRFADYYFAFPAFVKSSFLFQKQVSAFPLFSTQGDIFLNLIVLYFVFYFIGFIKNKKIFSGIITGFAIKLFSYLLILFLFVLLDGVLINQGLDFIFRYRKTDYESILTLVTVLATGYLSYYIIETVNRYNEKNKTFVKTPVLLVLIIITALLINTEKIIILLTVSFIIYYEVIIEIKKRYGISKYFYRLMVILFISIIYAALAVITDNERMDQRQIFMSNYISRQNDPMFEYKIEGLLKEFYNDTAVKSFVKDTTYNPRNEEELIKYLENKYLRTLKNKYNYQITLCRQGEMLVIQPEGTLTGCVDYFSSLNGDTVFADSVLQLRLITGEYKSIYYLADLRFGNKKRQNGFHLIIEFLKEKIPAGVGYAGLLQNDKPDDVHFELFSFAVYNDTVINYKFGEFPYPVVFNELKDFRLNTFVKWNGYVHYINKIGKSDFLIITRKQKQAAYILFPFTLFFFVLQLVLLLFTGFGSLKKLKKNLLNYSVKIQTIYFVSFVTLFAIISVVSIYYINLSISRSVKSELEEKTYSISEELQNKFTSNGDEIFSGDNLNLYLKKLSNIFFTDINLYGTGGELISTSRPEIFDKNLQSGYINAKAYYALRFAHKLFFIDKERINNTVFYSSYFPLVLQDGTLFGYVNLPYFAKENYLLKSRNLLFVSFFNLLVFIAIVILIISYFVTRMITKPLYLLQKRISETNLESEFVKIKWNRDDEIGRLINAYNEMVDKLKKSTRLLKQSERESAWREMARQIAHEIRNPLTPMKLNIQYLLKAHKEGDSDFDKKIKSTAETLITQIDALNNVAAMFSDFAKTKSDKNTVFDLKDVVLKTVNLFKNRQKVKIEFEFDENVNYNIKGDENDFLRILNNLIKNAIQSMEQDRGGEVKISLKREKGFVELVVSDTGKGIPNEYKDKIFEPYFTTKSKGTGIGLAIVYNLVKENGGEIRFETERNKGTDFYLKFPQV